MRKLFFGLLFLSLIGCEQSDKAPAKVVAKESYGSIYVHEIDGCEYVLFVSVNKCAMLHKQNCKFCEDRNSRKQSK